MNHLLIASVVLFLSPSTQAAASASSTLDCTPITYDKKTFEACATSEYESPSPAMLTNGTVVYLGGYDSIYTFYTGLTSGVVTSTLTQAQLTSHSSNVVVNVRREDSGNCTVNVTVSGVAKSCKFCSYCGVDKYTADCTNLDNGRMVNCESTATGTVYFPLNWTALGAGVTFLNATIPPEGPTTPAASPNGQVSSPTTSTKTSGASEIGCLLVALVGSGMSLKFL